MVMQDVNHQLFTESVLDEILLSMEEEDEKRAMDILESLDLARFSSAHLCPCREAETASGDCRRVGFR